MEKSCPRTRAPGSRGRVEGEGGLPGREALLRETSGNGNTRNHYGEHRAHSWGGARCVHEGQLRSLPEEQRSSK